ncbi:MAG TPA: DUF6666 family protein [Vicinamibacterales bacterium]|nr:DUF6666 family protein [Vicinamibacterales bacterium]
MTGQAPLPKFTFAALAVATALGFSTPAAAQSPAKSSWFENFSLFVGPDGSKQPQDLGINANMGIRVSANWGVPVAESLGLGAQIGAAVNVSDAAVHVLDQIEGTSKRTQTFVTLGLNQRPTDRVTWGLAYDLLSQHYYDTATLGQIRGTGSYALRSADDLGVWFTKGVQDDTNLMADTSVYLKPITQFNVFEKHTWANASQTTVWLGVARSHGDVVWVFPENAESKNVLVYGAELAMPLSERFAVTGSANLITPASTGTVDAFLGVSFYPTKSALRQASNRFSPVHAVANNPSMAIDLTR